MSLGFDRILYILLGIISIPGLLFVSRYLKPLFALDLPLGPPGGIAFKSPVNFKLLMKFLHAMELVGVFLLFVAAAGPHLVFTDLVWLNRGADIFFVVDVSPSMSAIDMNGKNRFDASRTLLKDFAGRRPQDAIGLIAVGEDAALMVPLTTDRTTLYSRLDALAIGEMGDGTALGSGLALAALHINKSQAPRRAVVLITDGENNAGTIHPEAAAAVLGDIGVSLWVIGVGSRGLVPFFYVDPFTQMQRSGYYDSGFDPENLRSIAAAANGHWIIAPTAEAFAAAFSQLDQEEMVIRRTGTVRRTEPLYHIFILAAISFFWGMRVIRRYVLGALL